MRPTTLVAAAVVLALLGSAAVLGFVGIPGVDGGSVALDVRWISDTARDDEVNHHVPAAAVVDGGPVVFAPVSAGSDAGSCALIALDGTTGGELWQYPIPDDDCTIHAVADPTVADYDADGTVEVLVATTENEVRAFEARSGAAELRRNLTGYGYTRPVVADLVGDDDPETVVVDVNGTAFALRPDGTAAWSRWFDSYVWANPAVADVDADGSPEVAVGVGTGSVVALDRNGSTSWRTGEGLEGSLTWMAVGQADGDQPMEIVAATTEGNVVALDGRAGEVEWTRDVGDYAAVSGIVDGDGDGDAEIYAVARDARLRAVDAATGEVEWTTTLTTADVQMTPPPRLGDVDGDGDPELVATTNDGFVSVLDPKTGDVLDSYRREVTIWTAPELVDVDGDGAVEVFVIFGDGRVVSLEDRSVGDTG